MAPLAVFVCLVCLSFLADALPAIPKSSTTWLISNFSLTLSPAQNSTSLLFSFTDPSPTSPTNLTCTSNTTATTQACGPNRDVLFKVSEDLGEVVLRRRMSS
ncbi:hypothetical protein DPSP01_005506 [Paraphaeosphaeria sporulosa]